MSLNTENLDKLQELSHNLKSRHDAEARMANLAARRLLNDNDEQAIANSIERPEYKEGAEIAYTYTCDVESHSFQWMPGDYESGRGYIEKPDFSLSLDTGTGTVGHVTNIWGMVKSISDKRFTARVREDIEQSAPDSLQILGLHNGLEIINPYELQKWMKQASILEKGSSILPIKILTRPDKKRDSVAEYDYPERDDNLESIIDSLFIEPPVTTIKEGILNRPDEGSPRVNGVIEEWRQPREIDDERIKNLVEIRDAWKDAVIVETESLVGDKTKYVALILPELESSATTDGIVKEWAVAENPLEGNALFIVNPYLLEPSVTWRDVLLETTKKTAVADGAIRKVHTPDGKWKERILDIITAPQPS